MTQINKETLKKIDPLDVIGWFAFFFFAIGAAVTVIKDNKKIDVLEGQLDRKTHEISIYRETLGLQKEALANDYSLIQTLESMLGPQKAAIQAHEAWIKKGEELDGVYQGLTKGL